MNKNSLLKRKEETDKQLKLYENMDEIARYCRENHIEEYEENGIQTNKDRLERKQRKTIVDLQLYEACDEIFRLLRDNKISKIHLERLDVNPRRIREKLVYTAEDGTEWYNWQTIARRSLTGNVVKAFGIHHDTKKSFVLAYQDSYRDLLRSEVFQRNGKIVESAEKPKTR